MYINCMSLHEAALSSYVGLNGHEVVPGKQMDERI